VSCILLTQATPVANQSLLLLNVTNFAISISLSMHLKHHSVSL